MLASAATGAMLAGALLSSAQAANASAIAAPQAHSSASTHAAAIPDGTGRYEWEYYARFQTYTQCVDSGILVVADSSSAVSYRCKFIRILNWPWQLDILVYVGP